MGGFTNFEGGLYVSNDGVPLSLFEVGEIYAFIFSIGDNRNIVRNEIEVILVSGVVSEKDFQKFG